MTILKSGGGYLLIFKTFSYKVYVYDVLLLFVYQTTEQINIKLPV